MPKSLLVADDSLTIRKVIGMIFATEDFQITSVDNGLEAISKARELCPDLVLADVTMPGRSGYEVCEAIKADPDTQAVPVLLLAGTFEPFDENRARAVKADDYIVKPFESQALLDKVRTLIGVPRPSETPRQVFKPESGARPVSAPGPSPRMPAPGSPAPASSTSFPGSAGPPRPSAPAYSLGQLAPVRPGAPAPAPGMRPAAPMSLGQPGMARAPSAGPGPNPAYSNAGVQGNPSTQYRPSRSAIPRPGPAGVASPSAVPAPPTPGYPYRPAPTGPQPMRAPVPPQGLARPGPAPIPPRSAYPAAPAPGPYAGQQMRGQPQRGPPTPGHDSRYGEVSHPPHPAPVPAAARADGGEALLREALSKASREVIEKIVWEVVPQLAETMIREHLDRLVKDREGRN